jgi:hypothetical protein
MTTRFPSVADLPPADSTDAGAASAPAPAKKERVELFISTPCYGGNMHVTYFESMLHTIPHLSARDIGLHVSTMSNDSLITRARNTQLAIFMQNPMLTHFLFIDSDIAFPPEAIVDLIESDYEVCACPYPRKAYDFSKYKDDVCDAMDYILHLSTDGSAPGTKVEIPVYKGAFVRADEVGTGFLMVKRSAFEKMIRAYPELRHILDTMPEGVTEMHALFDTMIEPGTRRFNSEDYSFCRRWRDIGGHVYVCTTHNLSHTGAHRFEGNFLKTITSRAS